MEQQHLNTPIRESIGELKEYLDLQIRYQKLMAAKKTSKISSFSALAFIMISLIFSLLLFLSFAFVWWYSGDDPRKMYEGYLIVGAFYVFIILLIIIFRKQFFYAPIRKYIFNVFFSNSHDEQLADANLVNESSFEKTVQSEKTKIKEKELTIQQKFKEVEQEFTFVNLAKMAMGTVMNSYMTTTTIAKLVFKTVSNLKHRKNRRIKKK